MNYAMARACRVADTLPAEKQIHLAYVDVKQIAFQLGRAGIQVTDEMVRDELLKRCQASEQAQLHAVY